MKFIPLPGSTVESQRSMVDDREKSQRSFVDDREDTVFVEECAHPKKLPDTGGGGVTAGAGEANPPPPVTEHGDPSCMQPEGQHPVGHRSEAECKTAFSLTSGSTLQHLDGLPAGPFS
eukprot:2124455-Rhodomonas_salina.3